MNLISDAYVRLGFVCAVFAVFGLLLLLVFWRPSGAVDVTRPASAGVVFVAAGVVYSIDSLFLFGVALVHAAFLVSVVLYAVNQFLSIWEGER